jgi:hypothetical protein
LVGDGCGVIERLFRPLPGITEENHREPQSGLPVSPTEIRIVRLITQSAGYGLDGPGSIPGSARVFSSPQRADRPWAPPSLLSNGYRGIKRQGREADHLPPSSAEVKKGGTIPPLHHTSSWHSA